MRTEREFEAAREGTGYPGRLLERLGDNAPERLYGIGDPEALQQPSICITGSRRATPYGLECAEALVEAAASSGYGSIACGGAIGIETRAIETALDCGMRVVAVLGCGCDVAYPRDNAELFERIVDAGGALVSEEAWGTPPRPHAFMARHRTVAALSSAVTVCECKMPSGTFSLADRAIEAGVPVLAVPGKILGTAPDGCNALIEAGATTITSIQGFALALVRTGGEIRI